MSDQWTAIQALAAKALSTKFAGQTEPGRYGLDRGMRVVRCIERLAPTCGERVEKLELAKVAALYATVAQNTAGPGKVPDDEAYNDASELAADQLKEILGGDVETVLVILKEHRKRETAMPEAKVLADGLAMEEFGLIGLWNQTRQFPHVGAKRWSEMLKLWKAQARTTTGTGESRLRDGVSIMR